jgi:hypothetical protein
MRAAVIDPNTGAVLNIIVSDSAVDRPADQNTILVDAGDLPVTRDWTWTQKDGLCPPPDVSP